jgi:hypothetical protein
MTYRLRSGELVTSKDGTWPTQYTNKTQALKAAAKIPGAEMIQRGRPFYVLVPETAALSEDESWARARQMEQELASETEAK